jgi:hypothetical protein
MKIVKPQLCSVLCAYCAVPLECSNESKSSSYLQNTYVNKVHDREAGKKGIGCPQCLSIRRDLYLL